MMQSQVPWIISTVIALVAGIGAFLGWLTARRRALDYVWSLRYEASKSAETEANTDAFLKVHQISDEE